MKMFNQVEGGDSPPSESATSTQDPAELKYRQELLEYNTYNQKLWKFRFLLVRVSVTLFNFFYHYINLSNFHASNYAYVRDLSSEKYPVRDFFHLVCHYRSCSCGSLLFDISFFGVISCSQSKTVLF